MAPYVEKLGIVLLLYSLYVVVHVIRNRLGKGASSQSVFGWDLVQLILAGCVLSWTVLQIPDKEHYRTLFIAGSLLLFVPHLYLLPLYFPKKRKVLPIFRRRAQPVVRGLGAKRFFFDSLHKLVLAFVVTFLLYLAGLFWQEMASGPLEEMRRDIENKLFFVFIVLVAAHFSYTTGQKESFEEKLPSGASVGAMELSSRREERRGDNALVEMVHFLLHHPDERERAKMLRQIMHQGVFAQPLFPVFRQLLELDEGERIRSLAARALGVVPWPPQSTEQMQTLMVLLDHVDLDEEESSQVRAEAAWALGELTEEFINKRDVVEKLLECLLRDPSSLVQQMALASLESQWKSMETSMQQEFRAKVTETLEQFLRRQDVEEDLAQRAQEFLSTLKG